MKFGGMTPLMARAARHPGFASPALCQIGRSASRHQAFHDVTAGTSTAMFPGQTIARYQAGPGWNPVTGRGSPSTQALVPLLAASQLVTLAGGSRDRRLRKASDVHGIGPGPAERRKQPHLQNPDHLPHQANPRAPPRTPVNTLTVTSA
jgi:hypothetical protein